MNVDRRQALAKAELWRDFETIVRLIARSHRALEASRRSLAASQASLDRSWYRLVPRDRQVGDAAASVGDASVRGGTSD